MDRTEPRPVFSNDPADFLPEALGGLVAAHPDAAWHKQGFIARADRPGRPRVAVISGGGSGHEPLHAGFVGAGMLDAAVPGHLFTSPNAVQVAAATRWADLGAGVVQVVKNYTGDVMNFTAARRACAEVATREVVVADDVATDSPDEDGLAGNDDGPGRRGTGAAVLVEKIAGAAAARGDDLDAVAGLAQRVADDSRSMAVALAPGHLPTTGRATFDLGAGEMEVGVGIHGERGTARRRRQPAAQIARTLVDPVVAALGLRAGDEVVVLVNGLGGTSKLELDLMYGQVLDRLAQAGVTVARGIVGELVTSVTMAGVSVTVTRCDAEVLELLDAPTAAPGWSRPVAPGAGFTPARLADTVGQPGGPESPVNEWLSAFVARVHGGLDALTELDRQAGDGDFGANMDAALGDVDLPVRGTDREVFSNLSERMFVRSGGTSGAVLGTLFRELARAGTLAAGLQRGLAEVRLLGGAEVGDRTLVDALAPAAHRAAELADAAPGTPVLAELFAAAAAGARATAGLTARKGRASYVADAGRGVVDPGAVVVAWLFGGTGGLDEFVD